VQIVVDIEVTNRCNAKCSFCPRDRTPHQGLMQPDVFEQALHRAVELRARLEPRPDLDVAMSLSGLGEPLLNRHVVDFLREGHEAGFEMHLSSNASLLDEERSRALLDAGLDQIWINVGEQGEDYEEVYQLPFERTLDNVMQLKQLGEGRCLVNVVLVDHRRDPEHVTRVREFWARRGFERIATGQMINRGGSLFVDRMQYDGRPEAARAIRILRDEIGGGLCPAPFRALFVGYDGRYYLCHSDWEKQVALGSVFDRTFADLVEDKLRHLGSREPVCRSCNLDPVNRLTDLLRDPAQGRDQAGSHAALVDSLRQDTRVVRLVAAAFGHPVDAPVPAPMPAELRG
jgi:MoaA/NifB/PqqE/SkfB family radical SAM enzyme